MPLIFSQVCVVVRTRAGGIFLALCLLAGLVHVALAAVATADSFIPNRAGATAMPADPGVSLASTSNQVLFKVLGAADYIGLALSASQPFVNIDDAGHPDGTATVKFSLRVKSYATQTLVGVRVSDPLQGSAPDAWGAYTPDARPGPGHYTVVPGSLAVVNRTGVGTQASVTPNFTGQPGQDQLVSPGAVLPPGAEFTLEYEVRLHLDGRADIVYNSAIGSALLASTGGATVSSGSTAGVEPDANGDGNPTNDASATPVATTLPALVLSETASQPVPAGKPGVFNFTYTIKLTNQGRAAASGLSVINNLDCAFRAGRVDSPVASWSMLGAPTGVDHFLQASRSYTGRGDQCVDGDNPGINYPNGDSIQLVNRTGVLQPGQTGSLSVPIQVTLKPEFIARGASLRNISWAVAASAGGVAKAGPATSIVSEATHRPSALAFGAAFVRLQPSSPAGSGMTLEKRGSTSRAELGDEVDLTLILRNAATHPLSGITLHEQLPAGLRYVPGSTRQIQEDSRKGAASSSSLAEPVAEPGGKLTFSHPGFQLDPDRSVSIRFRVKVVPGAAAADALISQSQARADSGLSNIATWRIQVGDGAMSNDAFAFGKVFMDCNQDGVQTPGEWGVPGVRLMLEDGTSVMTDIEGKWSLYGVRPITHALKVDPTTLPRDAHLAVLSNRQSGASDSVFLDLKNGEWHKANFAVDNCDNESVRQEVMARRLAIADRPQLEGLAAQANRRLDPAADTSLQSDLRSLPASGELGPDGSLRGRDAGNRPLIGLPSKAGGGVASKNREGEAPLFQPTKGWSDGGERSRPIAHPAIPFGATDHAANFNPPPASLTLLEDQVQELDATLGFIGLESGATVADQVINVRLKGPYPGVLNLKVNGQTLGDERVGKKVVLESKSLWALEFIGVHLQPGLNTLEAEASDSFGNVRERFSIEIVAPGSLARVELSAPSTARADGKTPVTVTVSLVDANGVPVHVRTQVTLENSAGTWKVKDLSPNEPGVQTFVQGGWAEFEFVPPDAPGDGRLRASANQLVSEARMAFLPDLRPLTGIGMVEGVIVLSKRGRVILGTSAAGAFESEINSFSAQSGDATLAARTAFYFKGAILGEYLLTSAYDSDKSKTRQMLRDIRPDQFYPIYGDSSVKLFDAQSTGKLYVRVDKNRSYLLYGDFLSASSPEVRQLSQISRAVNGVRYQIEDKERRITSFASRDTLTQQVVEFAANGTSGPFVLSGLGDMIVNSDTVEILVRDASQMQRVVKTTPLTRFVDYTIEPYSKTLLLTGPVSSFSTESINLNPQSIRVSYSVDSGGTPFWLAGIDSQFRINDRLQLGAVASLDNAPDASRKLMAVTSLARIEEKTMLASEIVKTQSEVKGDGHALRLEMRRQDAQNNVVAQYNKTSEAFDNPDATIGAGQTAANLRIEQRLSESTQLKAEALYSASDIAGASSSTRGATISVQKRLNENVVAEMGVRTGHQSNPTAAGFSYGSVSSGSASGGSSIAQNNLTAVAPDFTTVRARLSARLPQLPQADVFAEAEQGINQADKRALSVGGNYQVTEKALVYGRYALISSLYSNPYDANSAVQNNLGLLGIETRYMEGGRFFNEYRIVDTLDGRGAQAATGVRNTFKFSDRWRATFGMEHTGALGGVAGLSSNAYTGGLEFAIEDRLRASSTLEARQGSDANSHLETMGLAIKLSPDLSLLARALVSNLSNFSGASSTRLQRHQVGFAYRPVSQDVWNLIGRYEHRQKYLTTGKSTLLMPAVDDTRAEIFSLQANLQPRRDTVLSARYAAKWNSLDSDGIQSSTLTHLAMGRLTRDLNAQWDIGLQAGLTWAHGGPRQWVLGAEAGYQWVPNLWMSGGFNLRGLRDPDLGGSAFISRGPYVRVRFKFDENTISPRNQGTPVQQGSASP
jgi:uncharacterized repeat protein (TIGR01451 family)